MEQPLGFASASHEHLVCRLRKSLYGLKQAPRQWYRKFDDFIRSIGFLWSDEDYSFYSKDAPDGSPIFLILNVDDMLLSGRHIGELAELRRKANVAEIHDEGPWSGASYSRDEDHTKSTFGLVVSVSVRLDATNFQVIQHAYDSICYDIATRQPSAITEGLTDTRSGGGSYEVATIHTDS
jgi:hypothetical protein